MAIALGVWRSMVSLTSTEAIGALIPNLLKVCGLGRAA